VMAVRIPITTMTTRSSTMVKAGKVSLTLRSFNEVGVKALSLFMGIV